MVGHPDDDNVIGLKWKLSGQYSDWAKKRKEKKKKRRKKRGNLTGSIVTGLRWELSGQCSDWAKMGT